jgi:catecholate siderophore receptor
MRRRPAQRGAERGASVRAQANTENIFGRRYINTADNNITPGAPRTIGAQIIARF